MKDGFIEGDYWFTQDWVEWRPEHWIKHLRHLAGRADLRFLEIGCFEGRGTLWLLLNILTHPTSKIDCIDVFNTTYEWAPDDYEYRFDHNVAHYGSPEKVTKLKGPSQEILRNLSMSTYDCIYIDGSHTAVDVLQDAILSFFLLKPEGILIFDDYEWEGKEDPLLKPRIAIDAFLQIYRTKYEILEKTYQVIVRKA